MPPVKQSRRQLQPITSSPSRAQASTSGQHDSLTQLVHGSGSIVSHTRLGMPVVDSEPVSSMISEVLDSPSSVPLPVVSLVSGPVDPAELVEEVTIGVEVEVESTEFVVEGSEPVIVPVVAPVVPELPSATSVGVEPPPPGQPNKATRKARGRVDRIRSKGGLQVQ